MNTPQSCEVLVVDDNPLNREMLRRRLERRDFTVTDAENGFKALELINSQPFDIAIFDIMMPGMTGLELLESVRKRFTTAELPVIMATAKVQSEDIVEALRLGANDYITKPIDFNVLLARMQTHLHLKRLFKLKDEFLGIASHDLKNPLFVIVCQAHLIAAKVPAGGVMTEESYEMVGKIAQHAKTMQRIITDFLDFQAIEDGHIKLFPESLNLNQVAERVVDNMRSYALDKDIEISFQACESLETVQADPGRVEQVMQNLLGNAIKFNPNQGRVTVRTQPVDGGARFEVSDRGPGLSVEDLKRVFIKYGRLSNSPTGGEKSTGLGLAICKMMIDLHQGEIGVTNNPNGGACFWFTLKTALPSSESL